jgi:hypothetical protein
MMKASCLSRYSLYVSRTSIFVGSMERVYGPGWRRATLGIQSGSMSLSSNTDASMLGPVMKCSTPLSVIQETAEESIVILVGPETATAPLRKASVHTSSRERYLSTRAARTSEVMRVALVWKTVRGKTLECPVDRHAVATWSAGA